VFDSNFGIGILQIEVFGGPSLTSWIASKILFLCHFCSWEGTVSFLVDLAYRLAVPYGGFGLTARKSPVT
jgi:hypothetical protein